MTHVDTSNLPSIKLTPSPAPPFLLYPLTCFSHTAFAQRYFRSTPSANLTAFIRRLKTYICTVSPLHFPNLLLKSEINKYIVKELISCFSMKTVLFRTGSGSIPVQTPVVPGTSRFSFPVRESVGGVLNLEKKKGCSSPRVSLHLEVNLRSICRASSESDVIRSAIEGPGVTRTLSKVGSMSFPPIILEEDYGTEQDKSVVLQSIGSLSLTEDQRSYAEDWSQSGIPTDELGFPGGGIGENRKFLGGGGGRGEFFAGGNSDPKKIGAYYKQMLKSDPVNSLLLRNYGEYLHKVERDYVKAEECFGRAILSCPGDGEMLSMYGKLVWESERDEIRAKSYFDQAVQASPNDCTVLGSYAKFMWEADEDDEEEEEMERKNVAAGAAKLNY